MKIWKTGRRIVAIILLVVFSLIWSASFADGGIWYCPQCGRKNDGNFCPNDATPRPADVGGNYSSSNSNSYGDEIPVVFEDYYPGATAKIRKFTGEDAEAKRRQSYAGPGSNYSEAGAYKPYKVRKVEAFFEENEFIFVHLVYQTVDDRYLYFRKYVFSDLPSVPIVSELDYREAVTLESITPSWGPGAGYSLEKEFIARKNLTVKVFFKQNGYAYAEYESAKGLVRMWLPMDKISWI